MDELIALESETPPFKRKRKKLKLQDKKRKKRKKDFPKQQSCKQNESFNKFNNSESVIVVLFRFT